jgi:hypothetical protein
VPAKEENRQVTPRLNNLTIYVSAAQFATTCAFYEAILGEVLFKGEDIVCFAAGSERTVCVHVEGELGRAADEVEPIFWVDDLSALRSAVEERGLAPEDIGVGLQLRDPTGRPLRFITPPTPRAAR